MTLQISPVTSRNLECLDHIAVDVFDAEPNPSYLRAYLSMPNHRLIVAISEGVVVGQVRGVIHLQPDLPNELYVDNLGVTPAFKRQGVGTGLVKALMAWGAENGCQSTWLATETDNAEAQGFYEAFGFAGNTVAYYVSPYESAD